MKRLFSIAMMVTFLCSAAFAQDLAAKRDAAEQAARSWLTMVDRGDYEGSWQGASSLFQSRVSKTEWQTTLEQTRAPLGAVVRRVLAGSVYRTNLPNTPKGEYVIVQFKTDFASGAFIETVTPMLDKDGKWRVSGYFIKPALL